MKQYTKSIFIFRRDLRLEDNLGLLLALKESLTVIPVFIFTPEQLMNNPYKSDNCVQFMIESLDELDKTLHSKSSKLFYFYGKPHKVIDSIIQKISPDVVYVNKDYTPYSKKRDTKIQSICDKHKVVFTSVEDILLQPIGTVRNGSGEIYSKFTPFFNTAKKIKVSAPLKNNYTNYISNKNKIVGEYKSSIHKFYKENKNIAIHGGRSNALKILTNSNNFKNYNKDRNNLITNTTRLSAYIKFGCVSIREVYEKFKTKLGSGNDLIKQLYWREFYYNVGDKNTAKIEQQKSLKANYDKVPWITYSSASIKQKEQWKAWCDGNTGFPVVDAAMRELNETGFMHNRGRLIVASFLVKDMFWSPFEGEKYFSQNLIDIDFLVNSASCGNWAWVSGGGTDTMPYFRVFSPKEQSKKYDPNCEYIKKWIPELKDVPNDHIHNWSEHYQNYSNVKYAEPILDHSQSVKSTLAKYKKHLY